MAEIASAYVSILPSAKGFGRSLDGQVTGETQRAGGGIGKKFGGAFKVGALAVLGGVAFLGKFLGDSFAEAREAQKVGALTNSVIKSTGGVAKVTSGQVGALANSISKKTGIDDEAIQSGENLLLTFKNVRNEVGKGNKIFNRATQAAVDLSAAGFGDLSGTSKQLGKALNDPIKGITALSRSGVTFTDQQKKQIKTLVTSGKTLKAQKIILKEVESQVGGAGKATATAGDKFKVSFNNFKESVGTALLPVIDKLLTKLTPLFTTLSTKVGPIIQKVVGFVKEFASGWLEGAGGVDGLKQALVDAQPFLTLVGGAIKKLAQLAIKYAPVLGQQFRITTKVIGAIATAFIAAYNNGAVPFVKLTIRGFALVAGGLGRIVKGLGLVSGNKSMQKFGDKLIETSKKAREVANNVQKIPTGKKIDLSVNSNEANAKLKTAKQYLDALKSKTITLTVNGGNDLAKPTGKKAGRYAAETSTPSSRTASKSSSGAVFPSTVILRVGDTEFSAYLESLAGDTTYGILQTEGVV